jgi:hypothetical protein
MAAAACGKKDNGSNSNQYFSTTPYQVSTVEALINVQTGNVEVGGTIYSVSPQSYSVMSMAFQQAQLQGIRAEFINGVYKYRATITGSLGVGTYPQGGTYPQAGGYNQGYGNQLNVQQAVIHR